MLPGTQTAYLQSERVSIRELMANVDSKVSVPEPASALALAAPWPSLAQPLGAVLGRASARRAVLTLVDQVAVSGTNFATTVIIARFCLQEELGLYALGFSLVLLLGDGANALVWMPYTFNSPRERDGSAVRFTGSVTIHMVLFCLLATVGIGLTAVVTAVCGDHLELSGLFAVLAIAGAMMLFREHMRRVYLAQMRVGRALVLNLGMAGMQLAGLAVLVRHGVLSSVSVYWVITLACVFLTAGWLAAERRRLLFHWRTAWSDWRSNWQTGRWMFGASLLRMVATDIYPWVLAAFHGVHAVAILTAARGVIVFANPLLLGISNFAGPSAAHAYADHGPRTLWHRVLWSTLGIAAIMGVFCALVWIWGEDLVQLLYGAQYAGHANVVHSLAIAQLVEAMCIPVGFGLLAMRRADCEFLTAVVQLVVMVSGGLWLVWRFGPAGVGYGAAAAFLATGVVRWFLLRRIVRSP